MDTPGAKAAVNRTHSIRSTKAMARVGSRLALRHGGHFHSSLRMAGVLEDAKETLFLRLIARINRDYNVAQMPPTIHHDAIHRRMEPAPGSKSDRRIHGVPNDSSAGRIELVKFFSEPSASIDEQGA